MDIQQITTNYLNNLSESERYELDLKHLRYERDRLLEKTDLLMYQTDRLTNDQIEELKKYRQDLRNLPNINKEIIGKEFVNFPDKPSFIK